MAKKREKELAEKRQKEMEEADKAVYDESASRLFSLVKGKTGPVLIPLGDLTGLKVAHKADEFETGEDVILTLKDSRVLLEDGESAHSLHRSIADAQRTSCKM